MSHTKVNSSQNLQCNKIVLPPFNIEETKTLKFNTWEFFLLSGIVHPLISYTICKRVVDMGEALACTRSNYANEYSGRGI